MRYNGPVLPALFHRTSILLLASMAIACEAEGPSGSLSVDGGVTNQDASRLDAGETDRLPSVVLNEIMYHSTDPAEEGEFVELYNVSSESIDLEGWQLRGVDLLFPAGAIVPPDAYFVVAISAAGFERLYGFAPDLVYTERLSNGGEPLQLLDRSSQRISAASYNDAWPWPITPDGEGPSMELLVPEENTDQARNWHASLAPGGTPGRENSVRTDALPPWIQSVGYPASVDPGTPIDLEINTIDAAEIEITYVINFDPPVSSTAAVQGIYRTQLPASPANTLVRWRIAVRGPTGEMFWPRDDDTVLYGGTVVHDPSVSSPLPIFHWFMDPADYQASIDHKNTDQLEPAVFFHDGVLHDNIHVRVRGHSSRSFPKNHWKFRFPRGHHFSNAQVIKDVDQFNLQCNYTDKSYVREILSYETVRDAGHPYNLAFPVRLQLNGEFYGLYTLVESMDEDYLERNSLDTNGAWYKAFGDARQQSLQELQSRYEKKSREQEDYSDLFDLFDGIGSLGGQQKRDFLFDQIDLPNAINYLAIMAIIHNNDQVAKNYFLYRDSDGTQRWTFHVWDVDLTFGRNFGAGGGVLSDGIWADDDQPDPSRPEVSPSHPLFGDRNHQKWDRLWNRLIDALQEQPEIRAMYYRRLRTLADDLLSSNHYETRIDELVQLIATEAELDRVRWAQYGQPQVLAEAIALIKNEYLPRRRNHLFVNHRVAGEIPDTQTANPIIVISEIMYQPASDPMDEFVELHNPSAEDVDLSGWRLDELGVLFPVGTVLLANQYLVVARSDPQFRGTYGSGRFVPAEAETALPDGGSAITLHDRQGNLVDTVTYDAGAPWPTGAAGQGPSLELIELDSDNANPTNWAASTSAGGTPGQRNSVSP